MPDTSGSPPRDSPLGLNGVFGDAEPEAIAAIESAMEVIELGADRVLVRQGEAADRIYFVLDGRLGIVLESGRPGGEQSLGELSAGDVVGELATLSGTRRTATVRTRLPSRVGAIGRDDLLRITAAHPKLIERLLASSLRRLRRSQLAAYLAMLFGPLDPALLDELEGRIEWLRVRGGDTLFKAGDPGDALYIVLAGRLRVTGAREGRQDPTVEEIGRGQPIGMTAVLTGRPRASTVVAIRDTDLAVVPAATIRWFTERHPAASIPIMAELADRLERAATAPLRANDDRAVTFVLVGRAGVDAPGFATALSTVMAGHGRVALVTSADTASLRPSIAASTDPASETAWMPLHHWLDEREAAHDFVVYLADPTMTPWTDQCLRQADHVLIVADATADPSPDELERRLDGRWAEASAPRRTLVLLQPDDLDEPRDTARWLAPRVVDQHLHIRPGAPADLARLGRMLTGRAITLVLGGGGARGYAHIGVVRALEETGVPIDMVGGTSMGALVGAGVARRQSAAKLETVFGGSARSLFDPTPPIVSLMSGRRIWRAIDDSFHGIQVEDTWLPFFCISSNLTQAAAMVHRSGPLSHQIRASVSLPGILPPVVSDGSLLVDGGLLDTLPIGVMRALNGGGRVIAVDVSPPVDVRATVDYGDHLSGWSLLRHRLRHPRTPRGIPGIFELLSRTVAVPGLNLARHSRSAPADLLLRPAVEGWGTLELRRVHPIAEAGYASTVEEIRAWWATQQAPARSAGPVDAPPAADGRPTSPPPAG